MYERIVRLTDENGDEIGLRVEGLEVRGKSRDLEILYSNIPGNSWNVNRLNQFRNIVQDYIDFRIPLTDPSLVDDPDALTDPATEAVFHDGGDLVSRPIIVSDIRFLGNKLYFTWHRTRRT